MRIEHVAIYVDDLEAMKAFYMRHFKAKANDKYHNPKTGLQTYFLSFESGARLELMQRPNAIDMEKSLLRKGLTHLAFALDSRQAVDDLSQRLVEAGCQRISGPRVTGDGYYESLILDPESNQLEITYA
jgi:lactoylglutathione lyase